MPFISFTWNQILLVIIWVVVLDKASVTQVNFLGSRTLSLVLRRSSDRIMSYCHPAKHKDIRLWQNNCHLSTAANLDLTSCRDDKATTTGTDLTNDQTGLHLWSWRLTISLIPDTDFAIDHIWGPYNSSTREDANPHFWCCGGLTL
jgi:hypothetical protein